MSNLIGVILALSASVAWSIAPLLYKTGSTESAWDDLFSLALATFISALPLLLIGAHLSTTMLIYGALFSLLGPVLGTYMYLVSLRHASVGLATLVSYAYVILVPLLSIDISLRHLLAGALAMLGLYIAMRARGGSVKGIALAFSSALLYALSFLVIGSAAAVIDPWSFTLARAIGFLLPVALIEMARGKSPKISPKIFLAGIVSYGVGGPLFILSVYYLGPVIPSIISALSPVLTQVLAIFALGERPDFYTALGFLVMIAAILLAV